MKITVTNAIKIANIEIEPNRLIEDVNAFVEIEI
jgi:hypothetical protein